MNGKGSRPRKVDGIKYRSNYDKIFKASKKKVATRAYVSPCQGISLTLK